MKKLIAYLLPLGLISLSLSGLTVAAGDAVAGKEKIEVCTACHDPTGISIAPNYPHLAGQGEGYLTKQIKDIKSGERVVLEMTGMVEELTDRDIADISAFYASQTAPTGQAEESSLAIAKQLYHGGDVDKGLPACSSCHSPIGSGNAPARYPVLSGQSPQYIAKQLRDFREGHRVNDGDTRIMRDIAEKLSNKQIDALASYISGLR